MSELGWIEGHDAAVLNAVQSLPLPGNRTFARAPRSAAEQKEFQTSYVSGETVFLGIGVPEGEIVKDCREKDRFQAITIQMVQLIPDSLRRGELSEVLRVGIPWDSDADGDPPDIFRLNDDGSLTLLDGAGDPDTLPVTGREITGFSEYYGRRWPDPYRMLYQIDLWAEYQMDLNALVQGVLTGLPPQGVLTLDIRASDPNSALDLEVPCRFDMTAQSDMTEWTKHVRELRYVLTYELGGWLDAAEAEKTQAVLTRRVEQADMIERGDILASVEVP